MGKRISENGLAMNILKAGIFLIAILCTALAARSLLFLMQSSFSNILLSADSLNDVQLQYPYSYKCSEIFVARKDDAVCGMVEVIFDPSVSEKQAMDYLTKNNVHKAFTNKDWVMPAGVIKGINLSQGTSAKEVVAHAASELNDAIIERTMLLTANDGMTDAWIYFRNNASLVQATMYLDENNKSLSAKDFKMVEDPDSSNSFILIVPHGSEMRWREHLYQSRLVYYAEMMKYENSAVQLGRADFYTHEPTNLAGVGYDDIMAKDLNSYLYFPENHAGYAVNISYSAMKAGLRQAYEDYALNNSRHADPGQLRDIITSGLNIGFLLENMTPKQPSIIKTTKTGSIDQTLLEFNDRDVGIFYVLLLVPESGRKKSNQGSIETEKFPLIMIMHGNQGSFSEAEIRMLGIDMAEKGYAVAIPLSRAARLDKEADAELSEKLYMNGFTLMGLRVYETLTALQYLSELDYIDSARIGIFAHSSGASTANLIVRISGIPKALATDYYSNYLFYDNFNRTLYWDSQLDGMVLDNRTIIDPGRLDCQKIPALSYYADDTNSHAGLNISFVMIPELDDYRAAEEEVIGFFDSNLK